MSVVIDATSFSGKYGADNNIGDIIHVHIKVEADDIWSNNKEVILLLDVSGSMDRSMKSVKSSTLAFRDALLGKTHREMEALGPDVRDTMIRNSIAIRIITFSNDAKEVWSNQSEERFEDMIVNLESEAMTNMGDALKLAFSKVDPNKYTWIIAMTDGNSNKGPCKTANSFNRLVTSGKPLNSKIVTLGYGENFDPEVLNRIGSFVYLEDSEMIPVVLGNLAEEIIKSVGFNCVIDLPNANLPSDLNDDTIIVPDGQDDNIPGKIIVGHRVVGPICAGKEYDYIYLPHGNNQSQSTLEKYDSVSIRYKDIITDDNVHILHPISHSGESPSESIREMFFESESKRLIHRLYNVIQKARTDTIQKETRIIRRIVDSWSDNVSEPYKDDIVNMLETVRNDDASGTRLASTALNYAVGTGYTISDDLDGYAEMTLTATQHYLTSPLLNNNSI